MSNAEGPTPPRFHVFLSHAGEDKYTVAAPIFERLREHGVSVFFDIKSFCLGDDGPNVMDEAMESAPVGIFIMSPEFVAKKWTMRELSCFLRRSVEPTNDNDSGGRPLLIPIFYRMSVHDCRSNDIFSRYSEVLGRHGLFARAAQGEVTLEQVKRALEATARLWSIENDENATNSNRPAMTENRNRFVQRAIRLIFEKLEIQPQEQSTSNTSQPTCDQFTPCFDVPSNMPYVSLDMNSPELASNSPRSPEMSLKAALCHPANGERRVISLVGPTGVGKSTILRGIGDDEELRKVFVDGIVYISLGMDATEALFISELIGVLSKFGARSIANQFEGSNKTSMLITETRTWFRGRSVLFLVDDIWRHIRNDIEATSHIVSLASTTCSVVYTTRDSALASKAGSLIRVNRFNPQSEKARRILLKAAHFGAGEIRSESNKNAFEKALTLCDGLAFALAIVGQCVSCLAVEMSDESTHRSEMAWSYYFTQQGAGDMRETDSIITSEIDDYSGLSSVVEVALDFLQKRWACRFRFQLPLTFRMMHTALCVLNRQEPVPLSVLKRLWRLANIDEASSVAGELASVGLMERRGIDKSSVSVPAVQIHDLMLGYAIMKAKKDRSAMSWHSSLLDTYHSGSATSGLKCRAWWTESVQRDYFIHANVCRLLVGAGAGAELIDMICSPEWTARQLSVEGILQFEDDVEVALSIVKDVVDESESTAVMEGVRLIGDAARLSSSFVSVNPSEVWFQLYSRLLKHRKGNETIRMYLLRVGSCAPRPWLRPINPCLTSAGDACTQVIATGSNMRFIASTPNQRLVACGGDDGKISIVDIIAGDMIHQVVASSQSPICGLVVSNTAVVISSCEDRKVKLWDLESMELKRTLELDEVVTALSLLPDGNTVLAGNAIGLIFVLRLDIGESQTQAQAQAQSPSFGRHLTPEWQALPVARRLFGCPSISSMSVTPDGNYVAAVDCDGVICTWDIRNGRCIGAQIQSSWFKRGCSLGVAIRTVGSSFKEWEVFTGTSYSTDRWNLHSGVLLSRSAPRGASMAFSRDGRRLFSMGFDLHVWDVVQGTGFRVQNRGSSSYVGAVVLTSDEERAITCSTEQTVRVWNLSRISGVPGMPGVTETNERGRCYSCLSIFPGGKRAALAHSGEIIVWDVSEERRCSESPSFQFYSTISCIDVSADGEHIAAAGFNGYVRVWDVASGQEMFSRAVPDFEEDWIECMSLTADGKRAITGSDRGMVYLWDFAGNDRHPKTVYKHSESVVDVALYPDETHAISVTPKGLVVCNLENGGVVREMDCQNALHFSIPDILKSIGESVIPCDEPSPWIPKTHYSLAAWAKRSQFARQVNIRSGSIVKILGTFDSPVLDFSFDEHSKLLGTIEDRKLLFLILER